MKMRYKPLEERKPKMATQFPKPITEEQWTKIAEMLKYGGQLTDAAHFAGISYGRLVRNIEGERHLKKDVAKIMARCKLHHLKRIWDGVRGWQSSAWFLERVYKREFGVFRDIDDEEEKAIRIRKVVRRMGPIPAQPDSASLN